MWQQRTDSDLWLKEFFQVENWFLGIKITDIYHIPVYSFYTHKSILSSCAIVVCESGAIFFLLDFILCYLAKYDDCYWQYDSH